MMQAYLPEEHNGNVNRQDFSVITRENRSTFDFEHFCLTSQRRLVCLDFKSEFLQSHLEKLQSQLFLAKQTGPIGVL